MQSCSVLILIKGDVTHITESHPDSAQVYEGTTHARTRTDTHVCVSAHVHPMVCTFPFQFDSHKSWKVVLRADILARIKDNISLDSNRVPPFF